MNGVQSFAWHMFIHKSYNYYLILRPMFFFFQKLM